jgi:aminoglycoside phosphotransferase (APT) family kinase protein
VPIADDARARLARVAHHTGLRVPDDAIQVESWSNDVWLCGDVVVRVCCRGDRARLIREAHIGHALPAEARYPRVVDFGRDEDLAWMLVTRLDGASISGTWRGMPERALRPIVEQLVEVLRVVHGWVPPADVMALLHAHAAERCDNADDVIGHDILPLPSPRWRPLVDAALALPFVDGGLIRAVAARLDGLAPHDPFAPPSVHIVHGDVNYSNLLVSGDRLVAFLDYEWARLGPADADLVQFVRSSRQWGDELAGPPVVAWVKELYPELFALPDARERFWTGEIAYMLRQLVLWPPSGRNDEASWHPMNVLPQLVDAPWPD